MMDFGTLTQVRGDRKVWPLTDLRDADGNLLTTGTVRLVVKADFADANAAAIIDVSVSISGGAAEVVVPEAETTDDPNVKRWLHYDFEVETGGEPETLARGVYILEPEVALA